MVVPSVFSETGWVWSELDPTELGAAAWDLPAKLLVKVLKGVEGGKETQLREISKMCQTAPCKSLWAFGCGKNCKWETTCHCCTLFS
jgi:hypothetical protein